MKNSELEQDNNLEQDQADLKLDHNGLEQSSIIEDHKPMEDEPRKTARLAKLNLLVMIMGFGVFGYLHFASKASTDEAIAKSKATLKQEVVSDMKAGLASTEQLQVLTDKNAALEEKVNGYADQIATLEMKTQQFQVELEKNANLRAKLNELQSSMKKNKPIVKSTKAKPTKLTTSRKPVKKGRK